MSELNPTGSALVYSTYLGGSAATYANGIAVDGSGNAYVTGYTPSGNFPTTPGAFLSGSARRRLRGEVECRGFGTGLRRPPRGSGLKGYGIAVDGSGNAYVTGIALSPDFPTTPGALPDYVRRLLDAFVTELNAAGTALVYSTFLGGSGGDNPSRASIPAASLSIVPGIST